MTWWWASFADSKLAKGSQFLGALVLEAKDEFDALRLIRAHGSNPGGEVIYGQLPDDKVPGPGYRDRLLTATEARYAASSAGDRLMSPPEVKKLFKEIPGRW